MQDARVAARVVGQLLSSCCACGGQGGLSSLLFDDQGWAPGTSSMQRRPTVAVHTAAWVGLHRHRCRCRCGLLAVCSVAQTLARCSSHTPVCVRTFDELCEQELLRVCTQSAGCCQWLGVGWYGIVSPIFSNYHSLHGHVLLLMYEANLARTASTPRPAASQERLELSFTLTHC